MANVALKDVTALQQRGDREFGRLRDVASSAERTQSNTNLVWGRGRTVVTSPDLGKRWGQLWSNTKNVLDGNGSSVIEKCVALYIPALAPVLGYVRTWFSLNTRICVVSLLNSMMMNQTVILVKLFLWMPEY
ncbi:hypothetical protein M0802_012168 [Mischocyttarus mexicanus]|nr:hypothetical protein M0802_015948 [Mischocyttarus mexicanus]KAI4486964.1 hypothetical protein M0802_012148 [Mischocyttarus mexicanus]KAI4486965.1 hypothetical protein M0802_012149 [Mischocyttarus mexicanus]KAI4486966.1 hypothetical protein M0802_012150 [Mischocyttarus mexicanus]KAI4486967.1 hypothetical protein M0802_012151 [Mischocyttarus mexicanus]